jgi:hypothetical protein
MLAVIRGTGDSVELMDEFELLTDQNAEERTMSVPDDMVLKFSQLANDQISPLAQQFAEETYKELAWSTDDFIPVVTDLRRLSKRAIDTGKKMYLWNSL